MGNSSIWELKPSSLAPTTPPACQQAAPAETDGPFRSQLLQTQSVQCAAKAKAAETNNVRFNGKKEFHTEEAKPRLARGNTNKLWSTTTAS